MRRARVAPRREEGFGHFPVLDFEKLSLSELFVNLASGLLREAMLLLLSLLEFVLTLLEFAFEVAEDDSIVEILQPQRAHIRGTAT